MTVWSRSRQFLALVALLLLGIVYVSQYWSPSSHALALRQLGVADDGLVLGEPRPIRSDEWAVVTPLTQAAVNNDFRRINETSLYKEDLRINYGLPLRDWGLLFKPTMWAYFIVDAAHAYSFQWYATFSGFLIGYALLFTRLGLGRTESGLLSLAIYFTGYTQFWWNEKGPIFAIFPWVLVTLLTRSAWPVRLALFYWLAVSWLVTNFYPPLFLSLAFVSAVILLAFGHEWLRPSRLAALLATTACAGGTAALYLKGYLLDTAATIYPGQRSIGGGSVPASEWWGQLFPFNGFDWLFNSVVEGQNICEVGVVGATFALMYLCFMDYRNARVVMSSDGPFRQRIVVLSCGLALMYAWMLLPIPPWAGSILLWNHVQPERMEYAAGLMFLLIIALLGRSAGLVLTAQRTVVYMALVVVGWMWFKDVNHLAAGTPRGIAVRSNDLLILPVLLVCMVAGRRASLANSTVLMGASAIAGAFVLFGFNPIQSARPIFDRAGTAATRYLDTEVALDGTLAISGYPGAVLNGLGYASVSHVTAVPALAYWRQRYPVMPDAQFMKVFNRYSHIRVSDVEAPTSPQPDVVDVPLHDFWPQRLEIPAIRSETVPTWVKSGQRVTGRLETEHSGAFDAVQVMLGTSRGTADGMLHLRICSGASPASQVCAVAQRDLREAADNAYFALTLDRSMRLPDHASTMGYTLWTEGARMPLALMTQQVRSGSTNSVSVDGIPNGKVARFRIDPKQDPQ
jgi:hypothetical protein